MPNLNQSHPPNKKAKKNISKPNRNSFKENLSTISVFLPDSRPLCNAKWLWAEQKHMPTSLLQIIYVRF